MNDIGIGVDFLLKVEKGSSDLKLHLNAVYGRRGGVGDSEISISKATIIS